MEKGYEGILKKESFLGESNELLKNEQDPLHNNRREQFFNLIRGENDHPMIFFPDITDWYISQKTSQGEPRILNAGEFISDAHPINKIEGNIPKKYKKFSFLDFYRKFAWGLPVHIYDWYDTAYKDARIKKIVKQNKKERKTIFHTPKGTLTRIDLLASDGTWAPHKLPARSIDELKIVEYITESEFYIPKYEKVEQILSEINELGIADLVIKRSPFGKLVHEFMGFEQVIYNLFDNEKEILHFLSLQESKDIELVKLAAKAACKIILIGDHADENLISPDYYKNFCIPFYKKINAILHKEGKYVSTHLDGNFKGYFPLLSQTEFDILDGCTPAPMFNYEIEDLAKALPHNMHCYCGVPSTLFTQKIPDVEIINCGKRILNAFQGKVILNIGDILPPNGDIEQVIKLGQL
jgi:hypothetical protein